MILFTLMFFFGNKGMQFAIKKKGRKNEMNGNVQQGMDKCVMLLNRQFLHSTKGKYNIRDSNITFEYLKSQMKD